MLDQLEIAIIKKVYEEKDGLISLVESSSNKMRHEFFKMIFQPYIDTYNVVALVILGLQENHAIIDQ